MWGWIHKWWHTFSFCLKVYPIALHIDRQQIRKSERIGTSQGAGPSDIRWPAHRPYLSHPNQPAAWSNRRQMINRRDPLTPPQPLLSLPPTRPDHSPLTRPTCPHHQKPTIIYRHPVKNTCFPTACRPFFLLIGAHFTFELLRRDWC